MGQHVARNTMMIMANQIGGAVTTDLCSRRIDRWFRDMGAGRDEILAEAAGSGGCLVRLVVHPRGHELVAAWDVDHGRWPRRQTVGLRRAGALDAGGSTSEA